MINTRCLPTVRRWRRTKIVGHLCEVYHFAPLCLVRFSEIRGFATCTCFVRALHNAPQPSKSCAIEEHSLNCISVPDFASLPKASRKSRCVHVPVHIARAMHVAYVPHHQMQCTIELRITHIELNQCTTFGVASSKFSRTGEPLWRAQPAPHKNDNQKSTQIGVVYVSPGSSGPMVPFVWPVRAAKEQKVQNTCTCVYAWANTGFLPGVGAQ